MIYLDHAATSWPKPAGVIKAVQEALSGSAANPGRGNHAMAIQAGRVLMRSRSRLATLLGVENPVDIAFTSNTTSALNLAIKGLLKPGDHVIATMVEHNSVRRPLEFLKRTQEVKVDYISASTEGTIDLSRMKSAFRENTRLVVCSHSSNLLGSIAPIEDIARLAHQHGAVLLVDAAQTAGAYPIHVGSMNIDMLAFPGHKALLGPQGTGGLYISPDIDLVPHLHGGTGSQSEELEQPKVRPDRYEAGTPNTAGIAGLGEGVREVLAEGVERIYAREWQLTQQLMQGLAEIPGISLLGPALGQPRTGIVTFNVRNQDAAEVAFRLDREYQIAVRAGFHCTPLGHETAGTTRTGAVRASVGYSTTAQEVDALIEAMQQLYKA
ncbi:aminotransferase class V-fold PLP-dependent enzyme [Paenibacillus sp. YPG26]|uniref:aminotransferase class V-fold PLP-dependent enzyme n=1 Tax=Paenibacillus sp. YPG26 TaxID=2878915 RepID=UPI002040B559|nr:aminotransferase class V-fold PLP-dependent enzyme [Paenibacillus sp. YPG26]USB33258.1 aminotransferase class V-fold PLP-dependent enzyme [Paenibacillus sp. YPG26]